MSNERQKALNLLKTARGQIDGIVRMIDEDRYCVDVSKQILAVQALLKKSNLEILRGHLKGCVKDAILNNNGDEMIEEMMMILGKYMQD